MLCIVDQGSATEYTYQQLKTDNPNVSFPTVPTDALLAEYNVFTVDETPPPVVDESTTKITGYTIEGADATWTQTWQTAAKTPSEVADYENNVRNINLANTQTQEAIYQTLSVVVQQLLDANILSVQDLPKVAIYYREWVAGETYAIDDTANYDDVTYRCVQAHTSQVGWEPPNVPALWTAYIDPDGPPTAWVQPQGAHDAYDKGIKVTHNAQTWVNDIDANVWEPGVYGWSVVV